MSPEKDLNWLEDNPQSRVSLGVMDFFYIPLSEVREFLKEYEDSSIKQIAEELKDFLIQKVGKDKIEITGMLGNKVELYNGVNLFLSEVWPEFYIPFDRDEIKARKEGRKAISDLSGEKNVWMPSPFDELTFYEILSILILEAVFSGRSMEAMYGIYNLLNLQLQLKESDIEFMKEQNKPAVLAWLQKQKQIIRLYNNNQQKQIATENRDSALRELVKKLRATGKLSYKSKHREAEHILDHYPEYVWKYPQDSGTFLSIDHIYRIIK